MILCNRFPLKSGQRVTEFVSSTRIIIFVSLENRKIACYSPRTFGHESEKIQSCNPFEGSPFKQFWHHIGVRQFPAGSIFYEPLHTDYNYASDWIDKYRNEAVLTFVGKNCQDKVIVC